MDPEQDKPTGTNINIAEQDVVKELKRLKDRLYVKLDRLEAIENNSFKLIPKEVNHRNAFIFQERLRLISEISKLSLSIVQEISKITQQSYKIQKELNPNGEGTNVEKVKATVNKLISEIEQSIAIA